MISKYLQTQARPLLAYNIGKCFLFRTLNCHWLICVPIKTLYDNIRCSIDCIRGFIKIEFELWVLLVQSEFSYYALMIWFIYYKFMFIWLIFLNELGSKSTVKSVTRIFCEPDRPISNWINVGFVVQVYRMYELSTLEYFIYYTSCRNWVCWSCQWNMRVWVEGAQHNLSLVDSMN